MSVDITGHSAYMEAISREDARLEAAMAEIRRLYDAGRLYGAASAVARADALESHLQACADLRREYLGDV